MQPAIMPRPDIALLGINYRRIPILSVGRDVYLDTRLILHRLESLPALSGVPTLGGAVGTEHRAVEKLLSALNIEAGVFGWAATLLPTYLPIWKDDRWLKDRAGFASGAGGGQEKLSPPSPQARVEALANLRGVFELLESTLLADGRDWILGGGTTQEGPSLADIEAVWVFHWLWGIPKALPQDQISKKQFPKVFAWIQRFDQAVKKAAAAAGESGKVPRLSGEEAATTVVGSEYVDAESGPVGQDEPLVQVLGLKKGDRIVVYPVDSGSTHKDSGSLLSLDAKEVVFETRATVQGSPAVRVHAPRHGFHVVREDQVSHL